MEYLPNLYSFATKELAQDATLAYILICARPEYRRSHPRQHDLGTEMLRALLSTGVEEASIPTVTSLDVETQFKRIDLLATINKNSSDGLLLLIEDKVGSHEHSNQISRYSEIAEQKYPNLKVVPVYVKTGNTSWQRHPPNTNCGRFIRSDILKILNRFSDTGDTIVENFREHLQFWENTTNDYRIVPICQWNDRYKWMCIEGFYIELEKRMTTQDLNWDCWGWDYVPNPAGGFRWFAFGATNLAGKLHEFMAYLQIEDASRLTLRVTGGQRVSATLMYKVLEQLSEIAESADDIEIRKAGRFRGGASAAVAEIIFSGQENYLALTANGIVDTDATMSNIESAMKLVRKLPTCWNKPDF